MKIAIDARSMTATQPRGTGRNLLDAYRVIARLEPTWEFILYHQRRREDLPQIDDPPWDYSNVRLRHIDLPGDRLDAWFQIRLPLAAIEDDVDLLHAPANAAPVWRRVPLITTIHDLAPLRVPALAARRESAAFRRGILRALRGSSRIITPSRATRDDLCGEFGVRPERIRVVPWGPDVRIAEEAATPLDPVRSAGVLQQYSVDRRYFICFAGDCPRKNAAGLVAALAEVPDARRGEFEVLLLGCESADTRARLMHQASTLGVNAMCRVLRFVPHGDLATLIRGSAGVVIPSLCEGFGLPVLDAFACGAPVLASTEGSLPEVAGSGAVYCDPRDPRSIADALLELLDPEVAAALVARGRERLRRYSWEATARAMCDVYAEAVDASRGVCELGAARGQA